MFQERLGKSCQWLKMLPVCMCMKFRGVNTLNFNFQSSFAVTYLLTAHHAYLVHGAATKSFQRCLSLASLSMVLQL